MPATLNFWLIVVPFELEKSQFEASHDVNVTPGVNAPGRLDFAIV
jgi:hypothetical protein